MNWKKVLGNYEAKMEEAILAGDLVEASTIRAEKEDAQKKDYADEEAFSEKAGGQKTTRNRRGSGSGRI